MGNRIKSLRLAKGYTNSEYFAYEHSIPRALESEGFWKRMGFEKFPDRGYSENELTYFKSLIDVAQITEIETENKLELWNVEPHEKVNNLPKWRWEINDKLINPIIQPCSFDWNLRWTKKVK